MPRSRPPYPAEFRQQLIELARAGRTPTDLSNEFGCSAQTVTNWIAQDAIGHGKPLPGQTAVRPTLRPGDRNDFIRAVPRACVVGIDGDFGGVTEAAVRQLQRAAGLVPDGIVGPKTWLAVDAATQVLGNR